MSLRRIQVDFSVPVDLPDGAEKVLHSLLDVVCRLYETQNPTRAMWPAVHGLRGLDATSLDGEDVYFVEVHEREAFATELARRASRG